MHVGNRTSKANFHCFWGMFKVLYNKNERPTTCAFFEYFYIFFLKTVKVFLINRSHKIECYKGAIYFTLDNAGCSRVTLNKI